MSCEQDLNVTSSPALQQALRMHELSSVPVGHTLRCCVKVRAEESSRLYRLQKLRSVFLRSRTFRPAVCEKCENQEENRNGGYDGQVFNALELEGL
jgi:hypothetical protein